MLSYVVRNKLEYIREQAFVELLLLLVLVFGPWASLVRNQSPVRQPVWLWYAPSWASS